MIANLYILASSNYFSVVIFIVFGLLSVFGAIAKKKAEKKRQEEAERSIRNSKKPVVRSSPTSRQNPAMLPRQRRTMSAAQQAAMKSTPAPRQFASKLDTFGNTKSLTAPPAIAKPATITSAERHPNLHYSHEQQSSEVRRLVNPPKQQTPANRKQRVKKPTHHNEVRRIVTDAEELVEISTTSAPVQVDLSNAAKVKQAFAMMEILSPPIAMRNDRKSWDA